MSTRQGRRDVRPGPPVAEERRKESSDILIKQLMTSLYDSIQLHLSARTQGEITVSVIVFDGGINRVIVGSNKTLKAE